MNQNIVVNHDWRNSLHTMLLLGGMLLLMTLLGWLIGGVTGLVVAVIVGLVSYVWSQRISPQWVMRMYKARPLTPQEASGLYNIVTELSQRAKLPAVPQLYYVSSRMMNAFAVGQRHSAAIGMTDGILRQLNERELTGVLAHEMSHIRNNDLRSMALADVLSRITAMFSSFGKFLVLFNLPLILFGSSPISWWAIILMIIAPFLMGLLQLALSRTREFDADLDAVQLTNDPVGLASALRKLETYSTNMWQQILMPGQGVPQPSIFRTHPHTKDRIARLLELTGATPQQIATATEAVPALPSSWVPVTRQPRWNVMGLWY